MLSLFADNYGVTEGHSLNDYLRGFSTLKQITSLRHGILPGTLWCGHGNIAREKYQLGKYEELDKCCRAHDYCEEYIRPKSTRYGLNNKSNCRSSSCECEVQFYDCLKQIRGFYASAVRRIYFMHCKQCFRIFYDPQECTNKGLDIIEEKDRSGRRIFCSKFDRNSKWVHRHNFSSSESNLEDSTWDNDKTKQFIPSFHPEVDGEYSNEEFDDKYGDYLFNTDNN
ncbi:hypothetical protein PUN28_010617 [Cardiocondyla obscurior]